MKLFIVSAILLVLFPLSLFAQIPNAGFETWTGTTDLLPGSWGTNNIPGVAVPITRSSTAHAGSFSAQGAVVSFAGLVSYTPDLSVHFPYTQRSGMLTGYYQFTPVGGDSIVVVVWLFEHGSGSVFAIGSFESGAPISQWTKFSAPIYYGSGSNPDSGYVQVLIGGVDTIHVGSTFLLDDLAFEGTATSVVEHPGLPVVFALNQNYPNPFNPVTNIEYTIGNRDQGSEVSEVRLVVYDILGNEVRTLVNERQAPGTYRVQFDAADLPSGIYFYRLQAGEFNQTKKLIVLK